MSVRKILSANKQAGKLASWGFASQIVTSGANFATAVLLVRALGLENFGTYSICFLLIMIVRTFLDTMVLVPMTTIGPKIKAQHAANYHGFILANTLKFSIISNFILLLIFIVFNQFGGIFHISLIAATLLANIFANFSDFLKRYNVYANRGSQSFTIDVIRFSTQIALIFGFLIQTSIEFDTTLAMVFLALSSSLSMLYGLANYPRTLYQSKGKNRYFKKRHWKFSKWMFPSTAAAAIGSGVPFLVGAAILGEAALGLIRAVEQLANLLNLSLHTLQQVAPSIVTARYRKEGIEGLNRILIILLIVTAIYLVIVTIPLTIFSEYILSEIMGLEATNLLPLLVAFVLIKFTITARQFAIIRLQVLENSKSIMKIMFIAAISTTVIIFPSIGYFGELGIPIAIAISTLLSAVSTMYYQKTSMPNWKK